MKADLLMFSLLNCNKNYQRITQEKKPVVKDPKLKNVTPKNTWHKGKVERLLGKNEELI
tara:strand:+ start:727 stop:903 length:177 start_codon:yes stop_codon:yes gene_type:complete